LRERFFIANVYGDTTDADGDVIATIRGAIVE
jgi:hypothetical protein